MFPGFSTLMAGGWPRFQHSLIKTAGIRNTGPGLLASYVVITVGKLSTSFPSYRRHYCHLPQYGVCKISRSCSEIGTLNPKH